MLAMGTGWTTDVGWGMCTKGRAHEGIEPAPLDASSRCHSRFKPRQLWVPVLVL